MINEKGIDRMATEQIQLNIINLMEKSRMHVDMFSFFRHWYTSVVMFY